mgnify:CR=1 FL=1
MLLKRACEEINVLKPIKYFWFILGSMKLLLVKIMLNHHLNVVITWIVRWQGWFIMHCFNTNKSKTAYLGIQNRDHINRMKGYIPKTSRRVQVRCVKMYLLVTYILSIQLEGKYICFMYRQNTGKEYKCLKVGECMLEWEN